jgi:hypothetical protein
METGDVSVFDRVAAGEITPERGAEEVILAKKRGRAWPPRKPIWLPMWLYTIVVVVCAVAFAPFISARD